MLSRVHVRRPRPRARGGRRGDARVAVVDACSDARARSSCPRSAWDARRTSSTASRSAAARGQLPDIPVVVDSPLAKQGHAGVRRPPRVLRRGDQGVHRRRGAIPSTRTASHYVESRRRVEGAERREGPVRRHRRLGHVRGRPHRPPPAARHRRSAQHRALRRLAAPHTLARRIMDGQKPVRILGRTRDVRAARRAASAPTRRTPTAATCSLPAPAKAWGAAGPARPRRRADLLRLRGAR